MPFEEELEKELEKPLLLEKRDLKEVNEESLKKTGKFSKVVEFTTKIKKMHGDIIKSVLIFGSAATGEMKKTSDIDVWVVIDDTTTKSSEDFERIRTQIQLFSTQMKELHIQVNGLTEFWAWMRRGSPELFNYLRVGLVIYDTGFIKPVQRMLKMGLLPPSNETVALKAKSADTLIKRVELTIKTMVFDLRYAATDACQSVVMYYFKATPDPKSMAKQLQKLVDEGKLEKEYIEKYEELNKLWKDLDHGIIKKPTPEHLMKALRLSKDIINRMKKLLPEELKNAEPLGLW
ncbi:MAG: nucleotidyltransferase family protein [Candidatus Asgardarchaeia archaeon]